MDQLLHNAWLFPVGVAVGTIGTIIGAGGGFVLLPLLLLVYPQQEPEFIAAISLAVVFFNGVSGTVAYTRMRRIDYKSFVPFAIASVPGALLGAKCTAYMPRPWFDLVCGAVMILIAAFLILFPEKPAGPGGQIHLRGVTRTIVEADGATNTYTFNLWIGILASVLVGFVSSLIGIGGGIVYVPTMVHLLDFPVHIATATSQPLVLVAALTGTLGHIRAGVLNHDGWMIGMLAPGVLIGAQLGARLSQRLHGAWIIRGLATALVVVGVKLLMKGIASA